MNKNKKIAYPPDYKYELDGYRCFLNVWMNNRIIYSANGILIILILLLSESRNLLVLFVAILVALLFSPVSLKNMMIAQYKKSLALYEKSNSKIIITLDCEKLSYEYGLKKIKIHFSRKPKVFEIKSRFIILYHGFDYAIISLNSLPNKLLDYNEIVEHIKNSNIEIYSHSEIDPP